MLFESSPWHCLEALPGWSAVPAVWARYLQEDFATFRNAFLEARPNSVRSIPCPLGTSCAYRITQSSPGSITGFCKTRQHSCQPIGLSAAEVTPLQLSWPRLGRALCNALGLHPKSAPFALPYIRQIGSWSAEPVPVLLTIPTKRHQLRAALCEIRARLDDRFILLAPTARHFDVHCQELLNHANAGFFALEAIVALTHNATLQPVRTPGELFAKFNPKPRENAEDVARGVVEVIHRFSSASRMKDPTVFEVFCYYCIKELSSDQIAVRCNCSKPAIIRRMKKIQQITGMPARDLRAFSSHLQKVSDDVTRSGAKHIHRKNLIDDSE